MIFDPNKRGGHFFDIFDPPPTPPSKAQKVGFKWGGVGGWWGGGVLQESHLLQYGLQLGWDPPSPQLTTVRRGVIGTGHTHFSLPAEAGSEKLCGSR